MWGEGDNIHALQHLLWMRLKKGFHGLKEEKMDLADLDTLGKYYIQFREEDELGIGTLHTHEIYPKVHLYRRTISHCRLAQGPHQ